MIAVMVVSDGSVMARRSIRNASEEIFLGWDRAGAGEEVAGLPESGGGRSWSEVVAVPFQ